MSAPIWEIAVVVPAAAADAFADALAAFVTSVSSLEVESGGKWRVQGLTEQLPDHAALVAANALAAMRAGVAEPDLMWRQLDLVDWLAVNHASFKPLRAGRFYVRPSHDRGPVPPGATVITVDAGEAFGTGAHPTTRSCLEAIDLLARKRRPARVLDLGCGSGILAIAAAKTWRRPVTATDIDPVAVRVARANARDNRVGSTVRIFCGSGLASAIVRRHGPYDLVLANILARPLVRLARDIRCSTFAGARLILSGILANQECQVLSAYRTVGFALDRRIAHDGWHTLIVRR